MAIKNSRLVLVGILAVGVLVIGVIAYINKPLLASYLASITKKQSPFTDGVYVQNITYGAKGKLTNSMEAKVTLADGKIAAVSTTNTVQSPVSQGYVKKFEQAVEAAVVGKPIDQVFTDVIAGASVTTKAFYEALGNIQKEAKSR